MSEFLYLDYPTNDNTQFGAMLRDLDDAMQELRRETDALSGNLQQIKTYMDRSRDGLLDMQQINAQTLDRLSMIKDLSDETSKTVDMYMIAQNNLDQ